MGESDADREVDVPIARQRLVADPPLADVASLERRRPGPEESRSVALLALAEDVAYDPLSVAALHARHLAKSTA